MSAGRDDKARTSLRKKQIRRSMSEWEEQRKEQKARKKARKNYYKLNHKAKQ